MASLKDCTYIPSPFPREKNHPTSGPVINDVERPAEWSAVGASKMGRDPYTIRMYFTDVLVARHTSKADLVAGPKERVWRVFASTCTFTSARARSTWGGEGAEGAKQMRSEGRWCEM